MNLISRKEAIEKNVKRYFTGIPCKYGHITERVVANRSCLICYNKIVSKSKKKIYDANPEIYREISKIFRLNNKHTIRKYKENNKEKIKQYRIGNKEKHSKYHKNYRLLNREKIRYKNQKCKENNRSVYRAKDARRRAIKLKACPNWSDNVAIKEFYKNCPNGYHVDHIIPLQNDIVCGLHVLTNLQYLSANENLSKGNKFTPIHE